MYGVIVQIVPCDECGAGFVGAAHMTKDLDAFQGTCSMVGQQGSDLVGVPVVVGSVPLPGSPLAPVQIYAYPFFYCALASQY